MNRCFAIMYVFEIKVTLYWDYGLSKFNLFCCYSCEMQ